MASEEGYIAVELGDLNLWFNRKEEKELNLKVEVEITKGYDAFRWKLSNETKFATESFSPLLRENEDSSIEAFNYLFGFENLFVKSGFIELNNEVFSTLMNCSILIKIVNAVEVADPAAAAGKKDAKAKPGQAPVNTAANDPLVEIRVPFSAFTNIKGGALDIDQTFAQFTSQYSLPEPSAQAHVDLTQSSFQFRLIIDSCMAEFLVGSKVVTWQNACFSNFPHTWSLHAPDVVDPKAKNPPTPAELRAKYLENIGKHIQNQSKIASYTITVGATNVEAENTVGQLQLLFPAVQLMNGTVHFNEELAQEIPIEEDIRSRMDLWKVTWESSSNIFLHRSQVRQVVKIISNEPDHVYLPLTVKKSPTAEGMANETGEVFATAVIDLSAIITPGESIISIPVALQGELMDTCEPSFTLDFCSHNGPFQDKPPLQSFQKPVTKNQHKSAISTGMQVSSDSKNRNILQELRDEIAATLERIAQEYVALYPQDLESSSRNSPKSSNNNNNSPGENYRGPSDVESINSQANSLFNPHNPELEERKERFLNYLMTSGVFQELQEKLRLKVQLLIKDHYGRRGRALGKSETLKNLDANSPSVSFAEEESKNVTILFQTVLSELYVFLMKEVNIVMNSLFKTTVIQKELQEIEAPAPVNDEQENDQQIFQRLLRQGQDAAADGKYALADRIYLERLQLIDHSVALGSNPKTVHTAYRQHAEYLLKRAALTIYQNGPADEENYQSVLRQAREALVVAYNTLPEEWETTLLYACVLIQLNQWEAAEQVLIEVMAVLLKNVKPTSPLEMDSLNQFSGYESDSLTPIPPKYYAILASFLQLQNKPIECRKALLLANRSYVEGSYGQTPVTSHGRPRRTLVLILSETALYLYQFGMFQLADVCVQLAKDSEQSCNEKAQARDKPSVTPRFIAAALKLAESESAWSNAPLISDDDAVDAAIQAYEVAESAKDRVLAKLSEAKAFNHLKLHPDSVVAAYLAAIQESIANIPLETMIAERIITLETFVTIGKYLIYSGYYLETINILLYGCAIYNSATLCALLGLAYLRLDRFEEAEDCFLEGNVLDNLQVDIWSYLCMINIHKGYHRLPEAERCLFQVLRLGQSDTGILRELATAFMSVDKLQTAEDLVRRSMALEIQNNPNSRPNAHTRKMLGDILAGQNMAAKAIEEYKLLLIDDSYDWENKLLIAEKCSNLLASLGREEEIQSLRNIMEDLKLQDPLFVQDQEQVFEEENYGDQ